MDNLQFIQNEIICQFACNLEPECDYFVYDKEQQNCELIHGQKVECDLMIGPPDPLIRSCKNFTEIQNFTEITTRYEQCLRSQDMNKYIQKKSESLQTEGRHFKSMICKLSDV